MPTLHTHMIAENAFPSSYRFVVLKRRESTIRPAAVRRLFHIEIARQQAPATQPLVRSIRGGDDRAR